MPLPLRYRPLGEGAVLFNEHTWRTHVLTPAAALIYTALLETSNGEAVAKNTALQVLEQELDADAIPRIEPQQDLVISSLYSVRTYSCVVPSRV